MKTMCMPSRLDRYTDWAQVPLILNLTDCCKLLGKTEPTVRKKLQSGEIRGVKSGNSWMIEKNVIREFLQGE